MIRKIGLAALMLTKIGVLGNELFFHEQKPLERQRFPEHTLLTVCNLLVSKHL